MLKGVKIILILSTTKYKASINHIIKNCLCLC